MQIKSGKKYIRPIFLNIFIGTTILCVASYFSINYYRDQKIHNDKLFQEIERLTYEQKIQKIADQNVFNKKIESLKNELEIIKNKPAQNQAQETNNNDLASIVKKWRPSIADIECIFTKSGTNQVYLTQGGSGFLLKASDTFVITNRHVLFDSEKYAPSVCTVSLPDDSKEEIAIPYGDNRIGFDASIDFGRIVIPNPPFFMALNASNWLPLCRVKAAIGDEVVILGYPGIGSKNDITATEGIISGYDGDYYITSAKVEHGNSGGAAILVKDNCYLGIPTSVEVGTVESLARILRVDVIFPPNILNSKLNIDAFK